MIFQCFSSAITALNTDTTISWQSWKPRSGEKYSLRTIHYETHTKNNNNDNNNNKKNDHGLKIIKNLSVFFLMQLRFCTCIERGERKEGEEGEGRRERPWKQLI